jgi:hypothetical protein
MNLCLTFKKSEFSFSARLSKNKLPWISYNGEELDDSFFIIQFLTQTFDKDLSIHLTHTQKAVSRAMLKLIEESLSWYE